MKINKYLFLTIVLLLITIVSTYAGYLSYIFDIKKIQILEVLYGMILIVLGVASLFISGAIFTSDSDDVLIDLSIKKQYPDYKLEPEPDGYSIKIRDSYFGKYRTYKVFKDIDQCMFELNYLIRKNENKIWN